MVAVYTVCMLMLLSCWPSMYVIMELIMDLVPLVSHINLCMFLCLYNGFVILGLLNAQKSIKAATLWLITCSPCSHMHSGIRCK